MLESHREDLIKEIKKNDENLGFKNTNSNTILYKTQNKTF